MATIERLHATAPARESDVSGVSGAADGHASLGTLVASAGQDVSRLVRDEIELAKAEAKQDAKRAASGGAMFTVAALCGLMCLIALMAASALGIAALGITLGFSWLIVAGGFFVLAGLTALVGKLVFGRVGATRTSVREAKESVALLKAFKSPQSSESSRPSAESRR